MNERKEMQRPGSPERAPGRGKESLIVPLQTTARSLPSMNEPNLHRLLSSSPLAELDFDSAGAAMPVREIVL